MQLECGNLLLSINIWGLVSGFDPQAPVDSMQGLEIGSHQGSNFGPMDSMPDLGPDMHFDSMGSHNQGPGSQSNQMAAWFDTDL